MSFLLSSYVFFVDDIHITSSHIGNSPVHNTAEAGFNRNFKFSSERRFPDSVKLAFKYLYGSYIFSLFLACLFCCPSFSVLFSIKSFIFPNSPLLSWFNESLV